MISLDSLRTLVALLPATLVAVALGVLAAPAAAQEPSPTGAAIEPNSPIEARYLSSIRRLTFGFEKAGEGYFSPDSQTIVYQAQPFDYPFYQIYLQPLEGNQRPRRISTGRGRTTCAYFTPDGQRILFASSHLDPQLDETEAEARREQEEERRSGQRRRYSWPFDPHMDMFVADLEGNIVARLTESHGYDAEGAYSPDGSLIAFCSTRDGAPNIYLMNADGSDVRQLTETPAYDGGPFISPCGEWIVFRSDREQERYLQIYVMDLTGRRLTQLTDNVGVNWGPYWHPTEPYIIWSGADHSDGQRQPRYELWMMRYEVRDGQFTGGPIQQVTDHPSADVLPVFSPDGRRLMWTSTRGEEGTSQLYIADFTTAGE